MLAVRCRLDSRRNLALDTATLAPLLPFLSPPPSRSTTILPPFLSPPLKEHNYLGLNTAISSVARNFI